MAELAQQTPQRRARYSRIARGSSDTLTEKHLEDATETNPAQFLLQSSGSRKQEPGEGRRDEVAENTHTHTHIGLFLFCPHPHHPPSQPFLGPLNLLPFFLLLRYSHRTRTSLRRGYVVA